MQTNPSRQQGPTALHAPEKPAGQGGPCGTDSHTPGLAQRVVVGQQVSPQVRPLPQTACAAGTVWHWPLEQALPLGQHSLPQATVSAAQAFACGVAGPEGGQHAVPLEPHATCPDGQQRLVPELAQTVPPGQQRFEPQSTPPPGHVACVPQAAHCPPHVVD